MTLFSRGNPISRHSVPITVMLGIEEPRIRAPVVSLLEPLDESVRQVHPRVGLRLQEILDDEGLGV
jgi:hypothetical protein